MTTSSNIPAVRAEGLVKVFGDNRAVDGVDLIVPAGTVYGVLGPNGAGKTTTIGMLATLLRPDGGRRRDLRARRRPRAADRPPAHRRHRPVRIGRRDPLGHREPRDLRPAAGLSRADAKRKATELLERFALTDAAARPLKNFSGGMRRRLDLAASLIAQPPLIFLDEPTTGLDPRTRGQMWDTIRDLVATGSTVVLTTQYLDEADQLADRIAVIDRGRVVAEGTADQLKASVGTSSLQLRLADAADTDAASARSSRCSASAEASRPKRRGSPLRWPTPIGSPTF